MQVVTSSNPESPKQIGCPDSGDCFFSNTPPGERPRHQSDGGSAFVFERRLGKAATPAQRLAQDFAGTPSHSRLDQPGSGPRCPGPSRQVDRPKHGFLRSSLLVSFSVLLIRASPFLPHPPHSFPPLLITRELFLPPPAEIRSAPSSVPSAINDDEGTGMTRSSILTTPR